MKINTNLSKLENNEIIIHNEKLLELAETQHFHENIFYILTSKKPTKTESKIFSTILSILIDHGPETSSTLTTRISASTGNNIQTSVGAGILAMGKYHGLAIDKTIEQIEAIKEYNEKQIQEWVEQKLKNKETIYGYGHKYYKEKDPRVETILNLCKKEGYESKNIENLQIIEKTIESIKGKKIILNIDGLIAGILQEMKITGEKANSIFIIARISGLCTHAIDQKENGEKVLRGG